MIERGLVVLAAAGILATAIPANAIGNVRRETTSRRPYIVEVGEPYSISMETLQREATNVNELDEYLASYGYPDYAEIQEIHPQWPWESREVRLYYLRRNLEADFGHVILSSAMPNLGLAKFVGEIPPDKAHQIEVILQSRQVPPAPPAAVAELAASVAPAPPPAAQARVASTGGLSEALVARIEAAAERAAQAADRAVSESDAAVHAADRTENIVTKMQQSAPAPRRQSQ
jgi:citrate lyase gamma subunit